MVKHFIVTFYSRDDLVRYALDFAEKESGAAFNIGQFFRSIEAMSNFTAFSTRTLWAEDEKWESVLKVEPALKGVKVLDSLHEFMEKLRRMTDLAALDVARYILSKIPCTLSKLESLCFLCLSDYFCRKHEKRYSDHLFREEVFSLENGVRIESVYDEYKKYGDAKLGEHEEVIKIEKLFAAAQEFKILFSESGSEKIQSINETLYEFGDLTADELTTVIYDGCRGLELDIVSKRSRRALDKAV